MLNEIFKGMDNAAEKINENFEMVEINGDNNEHGSYLKFPGGVVLCFIQKNSISLNENTSINFPVTFKEPPIVVPGVYRSGGYSNLGIMMRALSTVHVSVIPTVTSGTAPTSGINATIMAIGSVEE